ncbi:MAG: glycosyltransferase [Candidatus Omnitrophica bacterium]|nr:glycosyltransferase [Candidatus Omnitrophota bacterium]
MKISVLICTYNRGALIEGCLASLIKHGTTQPDEIIIVDGNNGILKSMVDEWRKLFKNIKIIPTKNINLACSRNLGLFHCSGDIIALTDDDVRVSKDWIKSLRRLYTDNSGAGVIGGKIIATGNSFIERLADVVIFPFGDKAKYVRTVAGANCSYRREVIDAVGAYDESLLRGEDVDYNWRAIKQGYKVYYDPSLVVFHQHRSTFFALLRQVFMYGRYYYLVRSKWKDMYCVYPHDFRSVKSFFKCGWFFIGCFILPFFEAAKVKGLYYKIALVPFMVVYHIAWKAGIVFQRLKTGKT